MTSSSRNRQERRFMKKLMTPYRIIASRTSDPDAKAAIFGLMEMLETASSIMYEHGMSNPVNPKDEAVLDEAIAALEAEDSEAKIAALRERYR